jgi:hypothetical protein
LAIDSNNEINIIVNVAGSDNQFTYTDASGETISGNTTVSQSSDIIYTLTQTTVNSGFSFVGVRFNTSSAGIIDSVEVLANGTQLKLVDSDKNSGETKFQLVLSNGSTNPLILSPDPEVKNDPN